MIKRKLGINAEFCDQLASIDALDLIAKAGFEATFTLECDTHKVALIKEKADKLELEFDILHAPFAKINDMWTSPDLPESYHKMIETIDAAAENRISTVIIHISGGWNPPQINDLGLSRFDSLVDYAKERGVTLAFENLMVVGNVAYFTDRYRDRDNVGFCFDAGHEHCNTKTVSWLDIFCERTIATHIHDNFSRGEDRVPGIDLHRLPLDGTYDYKAMMQRLNKYSYKGTLMLEVFMHRSEEYLKMTPSEFLDLAYSRIKTVSEYK